jgi:acetoin utilization deacetylase AcuC-like enzyme
VLYFSHPACLEHDPEALMLGHPERPDRLRAIERALEGVDWLGWERREAPTIGEDGLELIHSAAHVEFIRGLCRGGGGAIDADTYAGEASFEAALRAAGGTCAMTRALMTGEAEAGFCAVRPPGHHAEPARAMGFCLFDNVAIAAELAIRELGAERVFVLDWDVHHGNGTAEAFRRRPDVLYAACTRAGSSPAPAPPRIGGRARARGSRSTCRRRPARERTSGSRCWRTRCCRSRLASSRTWC